LRASQASVAALKTYTEALLNEKDAAVAEVRKREASIASLKAVLADCNARRMNAEGKLRAMEQKGRNERDVEKGSTGTETAAQLIIAEESLMQKHREVAELRASLEQADSRLAEMSEKIMFLKMVFKSVIG
jgi:hypothetical protein